MLTHGEGVGGGGDDVSGMNFVCVGEESAGILRAGGLNVGLGKRDSRAVVDFLGVIVNDVGNENCEYNLKVCYPDSGNRIIRCRSSRRNMTTRSEGEVSERRATSTREYSGERQ